MAPLLDEAGIALDIGDERRTIPAVLAALTGLLLVFWGIFSMLFSVLGLLMAGLGGVFVVVSALTDGQPEMIVVALIYVWQALVEGVSLILWVLLTGAALLVLRASLVLFGGGPWEHVDLGAKAALGLPLVWFILGVATSFLSMDCIGLFLGNLPSIALEVLGVVTFLLLRNLRAD